MENKFFGHFRLPTHNNLKNLKNNFCVHPDGGWPRERIQLVYWPGCGEERLKLNFFELGKTNFRDSWWRHQTGVSKRWSMNCNFSVTFVKSLKQSSTKSCPIVHLVAVWTLIYLICKKVIVKLVVQGSTGSRTTESALLSTAVICISITDAMKSLYSIELEVLASCAES